MPEATPTLDYPTPPGLTIEQRPDGLRIIFPRPTDPLPREAMRWTLELLATFFFSELGFYFVGALIVFGFGATFGITRHLLALLWNETPWQIRLLPLLIVAFGAWHFGSLVRLRMAYAEITVTADAVQVRYLCVQPEPARFIDLKLPRSRIYEVKFVEHSGNLVIRAHGCEMTECRPCEDAALLRSAAEALSNAILRSESRCVPRGDG